MALYLIHGKDAYLILQEITKLKDNLRRNNKAYWELFPWEEESSEINNAIINYLTNASLFSDSNVLIIRDFVRENKISSVIEVLVELYEKNKDVFNYNDVYLYQTETVNKNLKIYKIVQKIGQIKEVKSIEPSKIRMTIKKRLNISDQAVDLLISLTSYDLFRLNNEIDKLSNLEGYITPEIIEKYVSRFISKDAIWQIQEDFINFLNNTNTKNLHTLLVHIEELFIIGTETMYILYTLYNANFNLLKLLKVASEGQGFKEAIVKTNFYFAKKYFGKVSIDKHKCLKINSMLLDYEYDFKNGEVDDKYGLIQKLLDIYFFLVSK